MFASRYFAARMFAARYFLRGGPSTPAAPTYESASIRWPATNGTAVYPASTGEVVF